ncbi:hypothetical protein [Rhodococcus sp. 11-3]|uniref:hypothetical protein n=1 Tax=Rhodococcus sp. 11-3 TaxID=2854796 RepID=UPI00203DDF66|nr:hypothetical protein [Rhodococcus sp. 11-3]USC16247.1 hypothetical protein KZJ41_04825 [Rhodococcus sp. 11-3]
MQWIAVLAIVLLVGLVLTFWKTILGALAGLVLAGAVLWAWHAVRSTVKTRRIRRLNRLHGPTVSTRSSSKTRTPGRTAGRYRPTDLDRPQPTPLPAIANVEDDLVTCKRRLTNSSYDTILGGSTTVPALSVSMIKVADSK